MRSRNIACSLYVSLLALLPVSGCADKKNASWGQLGDPDRYHTDAGELPLGTMRRARQIADKLELAYLRDAECRGVEARLDEWDGYNRECLIALSARHLGDELGECLVDAAEMLARCGDEQACGACRTAILLDDSPISELIAEICGIRLPTETAAEVRACEGL